MQCCLVDVLPDLHLTLLDERALLLDLGHGQLQRVGEARHLEVL